MLTLLHKVIAMALAIGVSACVGGETAAQAKIFGAQETEKIALENPFLGLSGPYWAPTDADVLSLEQHLASYLRSSEHSMIERDAYAVQYFGISQNGEPAIFAIFFCKQDHPDGTADTPVIVLDGGDCYFSVRFNTISKVFYDLSVNPEA